MDISEKAQQVRSRRQDAKAEDLVTEAEGIFDWILDLIDADTKEKKLKNVEVVLYNDQQTIKTYNHSSEEGTEYSIASALSIHKRQDLFKKLKEIVDNEEGFKANLSFNAKRWASNAIALEVTVN